MMHVFCLVDMRSSELRVIHPRKYEKHNKVDVVHENDVKTLICVNKKMVFNIKLSGSEVNDHLILFLCKQRNE